MSLTYCQDDGALFFGAVRLCTGYSGKGAGRNNPSLEDMPNIGPIPKGRWKIDQPPYTDKNKGPLVFRLHPVDHDARGRSGFLIHGDSGEHPGEASEGCIILPRMIRQKIESEKLTELDVI